MLRKAGTLFSTAYLLLIFGVYPFYMKEGYVDIGRAKYDFLICCSLGAAAILSVIALLRGGVHLLKRAGGDRRSPSGPVSFTDLSVLLYAASASCSFILSDYREQALRGAEGWYMGLLLLLSLCSLYFLISRLWNGSPLVWYVAMAASLAVFLLGILDRFSLYVIPIAIRQSNFISTLGNINWFCGYLSVLAPMGICLPVFGPGQTDPHEGRGRSFLSRLFRPFALLYTVIAFLAGFCQGSESIFLFWGSLFFILLWITVSERSRLSNLLLLLFLWCLAALGMRLLLFLFPQGYNYETENLCVLLAQSGLVPAVGLPAFAGYLYLKKTSSHPAPDRRTLRAARLVMAALSLTALFLWLGLSIYNTQKGIPLLARNSLFLLDASWGNGRGAALRAGYALWSQMPLTGRLFGAGPDCFSFLAYSLPEIASKLTDAFGTSRLTNAHNELLTSLVNIGLSGTVLYYAAFLSFAVRCLKRGAQNPYLCAAAVCVLCCLSHNMLSFSQVLNLPFAFLIMAMGEALLRKIPATG